jgi:hypothetical protein
MLIRLSRAAVIVTALTLFFALPTITRAADIPADMCAKPLAVKNQFTKTNDVVEKIAILSTMSQETYDNIVSKSGGSGGLSIPDVLDLSGSVSYSDMEQRLAVAKSTYSYTMDFAQSQSLVTSTTPPDAFTAFEDCMKSLSGFYMVVMPNSNDHAIIVQLQYKKPTNGSDAIPLTNQGLVNGKLITLLQRTIDASAQPSYTIIPKPGAEFVTWTLNAGDDSASISYVMHPNVVVPPPSLPMPIQYQQVCKIETGTGASEAVIWSGTVPSTPAGVCRAQTETLARDGNPAHGNPHFYTGCIINPTLTIFNPTLNDDTLPRPCRQ